MPRFLFPFQFGVETPAVSAPSATTPAPLWGSPFTVAQKSWGKGAAPLPYPKMERVYQQVPKVADQQSLNFAHRVQSVFPFIIGTGNQVYLTSTITTP